MHIDRIRNPFGLFWRLKKIPWTIGMFFFCEQDDRHVLGILGHNDTRMNYISWNIYSFIWPWKLFLRSIINLVHTLISCYYAVNFLQWQRTRIPWECETAHWNEECWQAWTDSKPWSLWKCWSCVQPKQELVLFTHQDYQVYPISRDNSCCHN